ncbi:MAG: 3-hydroxybutyryl-CoA dehydrogenase [Ignavibacteriales bacterium]|nr:3-hydroxybutyryl-CoA dehydrogenase [Ignavibacteriales bacterium]
MNKIAVIGAGTMGSGIAHVFSQYGFIVFLVDSEQAFLERGLSSINNNMDRQIKKGSITSEQKNNFLNNIIPIIGHKNIDRNIDLVIEAIYENKSTKLLILKDLDNLLNNNCIIASNTSSISITELGKNLRSDKFLGMHFMNPVPVMQLVELIRGYSTSDETFKTIYELTLKIDKKPVEIYDSPGFISNRILMPMINEAIFALYEGVAKAEDIDTVMKLGMNHPMGPLTLADFIGLDVCLAIMEVLYEGFNDSKYRPCPLLKKMVNAGRLGRKTKAGFFEY